MTQPSDRKDDKPAGKRPDDGLDDALAQSFPASDPPSHTNPSTGHRRRSDNSGEADEHGPNKASNDDEE